MDNNIKEYREKHPKCDYCKYLKYNVVDTLGGYYSWYSCKVKDKQIPRYRLYWQTFCKYYEVKTNEKNNND